MSNWYLYASDVYLYYYYFLQSGRHIFFQIFFTYSIGYSIVGVTSIGTQSCILSTNPYYTQQAAASVVVYSTTGSVNSDTFLHYYTQAASNCQYFGGIQPIKS